MKGKLTDKAEVELGEFRISQVSGNRMPTEDQGRSDGKRKIRDIGVHETVGKKKI